MGVNVLRREDVEREAARLLSVTGKVSETTPTPDLSPLKGERRLRLR
jgi:hypothetical protein